MKASIRMAVLLALLVPTAWAAPPLPTVTVYKSPSCVCCGRWIEHMKANGFPMVVHDAEDITAHKVRLGVPPAMGSCHTAEVSGYLVEGHVPAADVKRMLAEKPDAKGLVLPGMPQSAPGMDAMIESPYDVLLLGNDGRAAIYVRH